MSLTRVILYDSILLIKICISLYLIDLCCFTGYLPTYGKTVVCEMND